MSRSTSLVVAVVVVVLLVAFGLLALRPRGGDGPAAAAQTTASPAPSPTAAVEESVDVASESEPVAAAPAPASESKDKVLLTITGRVTLPDGAPAKGAVVAGKTVKPFSSEVFDIAEASATADDDGRYRLELPGPYGVLSASLSGYGSAYATVNPQNEAAVSSQYSATQDFVLGAEVALAGVVRVDRGTGPAPLVGATVRTMRVVEQTQHSSSYVGFEAMSLTETTSDAEGRFRFTSIGAGEYAIEVTSEGLPATCQRVTAPNENVDILVSAIDLAPIVGIVVDAGGKGVEGAIVGYSSNDTLTASFANHRIWLKGRVGDKSAPGPNQVETDATGSFRIEGLQGGQTYTLTAAKDERRTRGIVSVKVGTESLNVKLVLPADMIVTGVVLDDETGKPIEDATVYQGEHSSMPPKNPKTTTTDAEGRFTLVTPKSSYTNRNTVDGKEQVTAVVLVKAEKEGYVLANPNQRMGWGTDMTHATIPDDGSAAEVEIRLARALTISGVVKWEGARRPITGTIELMKLPGSGGAGKPLPPDGRFSVEALPNQTHMLLVSIPNYGKATSEPIALADKSVSGVEILLGDPVTISGVVIDPDDKPVEGAAIQSMQRYGMANRRYGQGLPNKIATNDKGEFAITGIAPGEWDLTASKNGYAESTEEEINLLGGQTKTDVRLKLRVANFVAGRLVDTKKAPIKGANMYIHDRSGYHSQMQHTTKEDGSFRIDNVPASNSLMLQANAAGNVSKTWSGSEVVLNDPDHEYVLDPGPTVTIVASVLDAATGDPVKGLKVRSSGGWEPKPIIEDANLGIFRLEGLKPGWGYEYMIGAEGYPEQKIGYSELDIPQTIADGEILQRTFKLGRAARVLGRVLLAESKSPVADQRVVLTMNYERFNRQGNEKTMSATTDGSGAFAFENVAPGNHRVSVKPEAPLVESAQEFDMAVGGDKDLGEILLDAGHGARIRVTNAAGNAKPGVPVELFRGPYYVGDSIARVATDGQGVAVFTGISTEPHFFELPTEGYYLQMQDAARRAPEIVVPTGTATLAVRVEQAGKPYSGPTARPSASMQLVSGASISLKKNFGPPEGDLGWMEVKDLAAGTWSVGVWIEPSPGRGNSPNIPRQSITLVNGQRAEVVFRLDSASITGRVVSMDGKPQGSTSIQWEGDGSRGSMLSEADGSFEIKPLPAGVYSLMARHDELGMATLTDVAVAADAKVGPVTLMLEPTAMGSLRSVAVLEGTNAPVESAWCYLFPVGGGPRLSARTKRDATGMVVVDKVPIGDYNVEVSYWGHSEDRQRVTITEGQTADMRSVLYRAGSFTWSVVDGTGAAVVGGNCELTPTGGQSESTRTGTTNREGKWVPRGLRPGTYTATVRANGQARTESVTIEAGEDSPVRTVIE